MPDDRHDEVSTDASTGASNATRGDRSQPTPRPLSSLLLGRPTGAQFVVAVLLAALGFAAVVQVRLTRTDDDFGGARRSDLVELLDSLSSASDRAQQEIDDLRQTRSELLTSSQRRQAAIVEGQDQLGVLQILTGTVAAFGPGITVTILDPKGAVTAVSVLNGIAELRDAGAEAIEINDTLRVVASTAITSSGGVLSGDGVELRAPYVIDVIGSPHTLSEAVTFPGGLADEIEQLGGKVAVTQSDSVNVASLHTIDPPEYSQPTSR
ncbi:MAG: DUF881 domain-containing protein [Propionibacteriales bacterium]|nr:DUF881 domain-containing protein [Propionibacteriales bacterium]